MNEALNKLQTCQLLDKTFNMFFIEGNIGAGKSTVLQELRKIDAISKSENDSKIILVPEPVDVWTTIIDSDGVNILHRYYEDPKRWAFTFQITAFVTRLQRLIDVLNTAPDNATVIVERSILSDRNCFATYGYKTGNISEIEWKIYSMWYDWFRGHLSQLDNARYIYLKTTPEVSHQRIKRRSRSEESSIPLEYLRSINDLHDTWFNLRKVNQIIIDVNTIDSKTVASKVYDILHLNKHIT